jgi:hypothetical protein
LSISFESNSELKRIDATPGHQIIGLLFDEQRRRVILYHRRDNSVALIRPGYVFAPNEWYHFAVTFHHISCSVCVKGDRIGNEPVKSLKLTQIIGEGIVANSESMDSALYLNVTCVYLFSGTFSHKVIQLMSLLLNDFVSSLAPTTPAIFADIRKECTQLFTDVIANRQLKCYNAHMTVGERMSINLARNSIQTPTFAVTSFRSLPHFQTLRLIENHNKNLSIGDST